MTKQTYIDYTAFTSDFYLSDICEEVETWIPDSDATAHMISDSSMHEEAKVYTGKESIIVRNGIWLLTYLILDTQHLSYQIVL